MRNVMMLTAVLSLAGTIACNSDTPISPSSAGQPGADSPAAADANPGGRNALPTIVGIAVANPDFSTLVAALSKAELVEVFNGQRQFTAFAPTNVAFDAAAAAFGFADGPALVAALDVSTLTSILTYHVTRGDRNATSVVSAGSLLMLDGNRASVTAAGGAPAIEGAPIVATDIRASNGTIHVIGAVMLPPALR